MKQRANSAGNSSISFVEHVRTVHFALIAASAGLILLMFTVKPYRADPALSELNAIVKMKDKWKTVGGVKLLGSVKASDDTPAPKHTFTYLDDGKFLCSWYDSSSGRSSTQTFRCEVAGTPSSPPWQHDPDNQWVPAPGEFPEKLPEFRTWWDHMRTPLELKFPEIVSGGQIKVVDDASRAEAGEEYKRELDYCRKHYNPVGNYKNWLDNNCQAHAHPSPGDLTLDPRELDVSTERNDKSTHTAIAVSVEPRDGITEMKLTARDLRAFRGESSSTLTIPVVWATRYVLTQEKLIQEAAVPSGREGSFEDSFPELAVFINVSKVVAYDDVRALLNEEIQKGQRSVDVFGLKIPTDDATIWGILLILAFQTYLFVHIQELRGRLRPNDAGWGVAWVGMYGTSLSRVIFVLSIIALPAYAVGILGWRGFNHFKVEGANHWRTAPYALGYILSFAASVVLGWASWKSRPVSLAADTSVEISTSGETAGPRDIQTIPIAPPEPK